jgi:outer membrane lipoprotein-sorting protein
MMRTPGANMTTIRTLVLTLLALALAGQAAAQDDAQTIIDAMIENLRAERVTATMAMTVTRDDRVDAYVIETLAVGEDRSLIRVIEPARDAGQAFLSVDQNLFVYNPRLRRVLRLPPSGRSDSFLGSDLSFNDLAGDDYRDGYSATVLERDDSIVTLELIPADDAPTPYGRLLWSADTETLTPTRLVFFDQRGQAVREIVFSEVVESGGRFIPTRFEVRDLLREGSSTVATYTAVDFETAIPDSCFRQEALERGCE